MDDEDDKKLSTSILVRGKDGITRDAFSGGRRDAMNARYSPSRRVKPHINALLETAYFVIYAELAKAAEAAENGGLSSKDAAKFKNLVESLAKLAREEREQEAKNDPKALSDDELIQVAKIAEAVLVPKLPAPEGGNDGDD